MVKPQVMGKKKRLRQIFRDDNKSVIIPMDHGLTEGPIKGLTDMQVIVDKIRRGHADAVVVHKGVARHVDTGRMGLIVHLTGSTNISLEPNRKVAVSSLEEAFRLGADAVSVHINIGSEREHEMLQTVGRISDECDRFSMPLLAMMYPRGPKITSEHDPHLVKHAARVATELGADIIKTVYTGSTESFREVTKSCPIPIVIAGGLKTETERDFLQNVHEAMEAGGAGVSIGRNVFQHKNPTGMVKALNAIVHRNLDVDSAMKFLGEN
jgi:fructose-bisphosphate aldolase/2-amino-3,7-dideoxy-D-threo-hept-6-ulosonate synthase